ncbi:30S ribosomal protein S8 [Halieaceae bacterium IMCC14734]|uniref:Small ribosomal subunit protein uS8 n=1 Tax=Candidatus Litorirhabdus singularis TaxID=2518993 RepID=A0ABT3TAY7_9GAMM|nr:30S ribosomal protein S8 [Candidatus Litorirhabdus singularis]MCX2979420.1 30S ribosomal protein S8 [Candidatus Litorirhabdus singularis]
MTMQDPLADMLTRIRNAQMAGKPTVDFPAANVKAAVCAVLKDEGYIADYASVESAGKPTIRVELKYFEGKPVIAEIDRASRPGLRSYSGKGDLPSVRSGLGVAIISTSKGVMTDRAAREAGIGGEVLCTVF